MTGPVLLASCCSASTCASAAAGAASHAGTVRYFAYGANMAQSILAKRGVVPLSACPAKLPASQCIAFRHRGGYATIADSPSSPGTALAWLELPQSPFTKRDRLPDASAAGESGSSDSLSCWGPHGVLYEITGADMRQLESRETGYKLSNAGVSLYDGQEIDALMFTSQSLLLLPASMPPQQRYLELMVAGARMHGLCPRYTEWLHDLPIAKSGRLGREYYDTPSELLARSASVGLAACATFFAAMH